MMLKENGLYDSKGKKLLLREKRMLIAFPGVQPTRDARSDIIIRGNSAAVMLWRLEGIDIPNPNHFARKGSSGGGITIFSSSMLDNSDFSSGTFPAEYGDALSGVFDMRFRKGNKEKTVYDQNGIDRH